MGGQQTKTETQTQETKSTERPFHNERFKFSPFWPFLCTEQVFSFTKNVVFNNTHKWILNTEISHCSADMKTENLEN